MRDFPDVQDEPTSYIPAIATNDDFPRYSVVSCPKCGERAFKKRKGGGVSSIACRGCRSNALMLQRKVNYGSSWGEVRQWVLERDKNECAKCGDEQELEVHHIEKIVWYETTAEANLSENLLTLCKECHREVEGWTSERVYDHFRKV